MNEMASDNIARAGGTRLSAACGIPRTCGPEMEAYIDKANVLHVVSPGLDVNGEYERRLFVSDGGTLCDQYESNRSCSVNLKVAHELGSTKVASSPWLGIPMSRCYPEISGSRADTRQEPCICSVQSI